MDFSKTLLNCSRLGIVMSEPRGAMTDKMFERLEYLKGRPEPTPKQEVERIELQFRMDNYDPTALSKGCSLYLMFLYQYLKYGKQHQINASKGAAQMIKGSQMEKSCLDLIKRTTGQQLYRYKANLKNDYLKGQLDVINAKYIEDASKIIDIKSCYTHYDFMKKTLMVEAQRSDSFQMQGYLAMTNKEYGQVYYCLADFTEEAIEEEKNKLVELLCPDGILTEYFMEEWAAVENSMRFQHVPDEERLIVQTIERDEKIIAKIYEKVEFCREWLAGFEQKHQMKIANQISLWQKELY